MSSFSNQDIGIAVGYEVWSTEYFVDQFFVCLAGVREQITNSDGKKLFVMKYYHQARETIKSIPIWRPSPIFIINISDLPERIIKEFEAITDDGTRSYVLTQAVGRIFENLDFQYYHLSIARNLRVGFEK